jgi:hypothetical protein
MFCRIVWKFTDVSRVFSSSIVRTMISQRCVLVLYLIGLNHIELLKAIVSYSHLLFHYLFNCSHKHVIRLYCLGLVSFSART